jgi:hypothetical protein
VSTYPPRLRAGPRAVQRRRPVSLIPSVTVVQRSCYAANLPKCCLPDARRPEDLCYLPAHVSARHVMAR